MGQALAAVFVGHVKAGDLGADGRVFVNGESGVGHHGRFVDVVDGDGDAGGVAQARHAVVVHADGEDVAVGEFEVDARRVEHLEFASRGDLKGAACVARVDEVGEDVG